MPQLDFSSYPPQLIWLAIVFFALYMVLSRLALPSIGGVLEQRRDRIAADLDEAVRLKEESEKALAAYEAALAEAKAKAHAIAQETRDKLNGETERLRPKSRRHCRPRPPMRKPASTKPSRLPYRRSRKWLQTPAAASSPRLIGGRITKAKVTKAINEVLKG